MWVGSVVYFCSIGTNRVRDIASCKEMKSNLMLPLSDSPGWMAYLLASFGSTAFCTLIFTAVVFYLVFLLPRAKRILSSFTTPFFPLRKGNPLQEEKETLCVLRMEEGWRWKRLRKVWREVRDWDWSGG